MAERASVAQHIQIGVEATSGTAVAATKQLRSLGIAPTPHMTVNQYRPDGQKFVALAIEGQEWIEAALTGAATYDELVYPLSSVLGAATVTSNTVTLPTLSAALTITPTTTLAVTALPKSVAVGDTIILTSGGNTQSVIAAAAAASSATSITVVSFTPNFAYPIGTAVDDIYSWHSGVWTFTPNAFAPDNPKSFTVQHGDSVVRADQFSYGLVTDTQFTIDRTKFDISGTMLGQILTDNITFTANPVFLPLVPIVPSTLNVFMDTTFAGIGSTRLSRVLSFDWHLASKQGPLWAVDSTKSSWAAAVELVPALTATMLMEADAAGMGLLNNVRAGSTVYVQMTATGPTIGQSGSSYGFTLSLPLKVINTQGFSDHNGVYAIQWEFAAVYDAAASYAMQLVLTNALTAL